MSEGDRRERDAGLKWGVSARPLRQDEIGRGRTEASTRSSSTPTRPPRGGSAVPPKATQGD